MRFVLSTARQARRSHECSSWPMLTHDKLVGNDSRKVRRTMPLVIELGSAFSMTSGDISIVTKPTT